MPPRSKCLATVSNETTIHGIKDLHSADTLPRRVFWAVVICTCLCTMAYQMVDVVESYLHEETGAMVGSNLVNNYPTLSFCREHFANLPKYRSLGPEFENLADEDLSNLDLYVSGFFFYGRLGTHIRIRKPVDQSKLLEFEPMVEKVLQERFNNSLTGLIKAVAYQPDEVIAHYSIMPTHNELIKGVFVSQGGPCYTLSSNSSKPVAPLYTETAIFTIDLAASPYATKSDRTFVHVGGIECHGSLGTNQNPLLPGWSYILNLKMHKIERANLRRRPCTAAFGSADYARCVISHLGQVCGRCRYAAFETPFYPEENGTKRICNYARDTAFDCGADVITQIEMTCDPPCKSEVGEVRIVGYGENGGNDGNISLSVYLDSRDLSLHIMEYQIYKTATFLSTLGGILSLYCGASILSIFQLFYLAYKAKQKQKRTDS